MQRVRAREVMRDPELVLAPELRIGAAMRELVDAGESAAPVLDEHGQPLGTLRVRDLLARLVGYAPAASGLEALDAPGEPVSWVEGRDVAELMAAPAPTCAPDTPLDEVFRAMDRSGQDRVLVLDGPRVCGVVDSESLRRSFLASVRA